MVEAAAADAIQRVPAQMRLLELEDLEAAGTAIQVFLRLPLYQVRLTRAAAAVAAAEQMRQEHPAGLAS
jgi:hypothetical protein